jgi:hypothetical protein
MTAVAFAATKISGPHAICPGLKRATYSLQLPEVWVAAGVAWDLSADFDYVATMDFGASTLIADHSRKFAFIGTIVTAEGRGKGMVAGAGVSLVAHHDPADATSSLQAFGSVANSVDLKATTALLVTVTGC